jgi:hypothetical protein
MKKIIGRINLNSIVALYFIGICIFLICNVDTHLWDFKVYYAASKCYLNGTNPYSISKLYSYSNNIADLPFMYPPISIYFFLPFTLFDLHTASLIYLIIKIILICLSFFISLKILKNNYLLNYFSFFCLLSFNACLFKDLQTGNIASIELLVLTLSFIQLEKKKYLFFTLLISFIGFFKIIPFIFLILLLFTKHQKKFYYFSIGCGIFIIYIFLNYSIENKLFNEYLFHFSKNAIIEGGMSNPSSLELIKETFRTIHIDDQSIMLYLTYIFFISLISFITLKKIKINKSNELTYELIFIIFIAINLCLPRLKDYTFVTLIIPSFYLIANLKVNQKFIVIFVLLSSFSSLNTSIPIYKDVLQLVNRYYSLIYLLVIYFLYINEYNIKQT